MKMKPNMRKGNKYAEAREWAYDLIANSTNTRSTDMADMMAEQFRLDRKVMLHTLGQMARVGILKVVGDTIHNGKRVHMLAANKRRSNVPVPVLTDFVRPVPVTPAPNGSGVYVLVQTVNGPVQLTVAQAKALNEGLSGLFK